MKRPTLSVVIPAYNEAEVVELCLSAVCAQADELEQIILVNNNSTDATAAIVRRLRAKQPKLRLLNETTPGLLATRDRGLDAAISDLVARIDADTLVQPGWAAAMRDFFAEQKHRNIGAATGAVTYYDIPLRHFFRWWIDLFFKSSNRTSDGQIGHLYGANMVLRRDTWQRVRTRLHNRADIMEDLDIALSVGKLGQNLAFIPEMRAEVSARRYLMNPLSYWNYQRFWPNTYRVYGMQAKMRRTYVMAVLGYAFQILVWLPLKCFNPVTRRFSLRYGLSSAERVLPDQ